jgi:hypothetical protein
MSNEVPHWVDDGAMNWAPERPVAPPAPRPGPWSPPITETRSEIRPEIHLGLWPWRLGVGLAQGFFFYLLFAARTAGIWPGADPFLFDALALAERGDEVRCGRTLGHGGADRRPRLRPQPVRP